MIKFVDLTGVLDAPKRVFAFYNSETEHFLSFFNKELWNSANDFKECLEQEKDKDSDLHIEEYLRLIPEGY